MNLLLDTHAVIWFMTDDGKLKEGNKELVESKENNAFVSIASLWEMGIKHSLYKLTLRTELKEVFELIERSGFEVLPITPEHILTSASLPFHHRDPFDRLLIAQAKSEQLLLMTKDPWVLNYEVQSIW
ncbi:MAG: type II toxin-antitoxin system VapC family toxin [Bacteroidota bacterium]